MYNHKFVKGTRRNAKKKEKSLERLRNKLPENKDVFNEREKKGGWGDSGTKDGGEGEQRKENKAHCTSHTAYLSHLIVFPVFGSLIFRPPNPSAKRFNRISHPAAAFHKTFVIRQSFNKLCHKLHSGQNIIISKI